MRILICDDEPLVCEKIESLLRNYFQRKNIKDTGIVSFYDGESLAKDSGRKDIIFLDIEMPGMNGIYLGNYLRRKDENTIIIVITSYAEYLDDAMRFHVFRYLSKPIDESRFYRNLEDAIGELSGRSVKMTIENGKRTIVVESRDIIMIESLGRKTIVHTVDNDFCSLENITYWSEILPKERFIMSHRSFLVNLEYVKDFDRESVTLSKRDLTAYLTRRKYSEFRNAYLLYLGR